MLLRDQNGRVLAEPLGKTITPIHKEIVTGAVATVDIDTAIDWTFWDSVIFKVRKLTVDTDDVDILLRVFDTTLAAWQSDAADYMQSGWKDLIGTITSIYTGSATEISLTGPVGAARGVGNGANEAFWCDIEIHNPQDTALVKPIDFNSKWLDTTTLINKAVGTGFYVGALNAISGFRFSPGSGNIDGAEITVYGVRGYGN